MTAETWKASDGEPRARITLKAREIAASMAFDTLRTNYAARRAARAAAANGEVTDLPATSRPRLRCWPASLPPPDPARGGRAIRSARPFCPASSRSFP